MPEMRVWWTTREMSWGSEPAAQFWPWSPIPWLHPREGLMLPYWYAPPFRGNSSVTNTGNLHRCQRKHLKDKSMGSQRILLKTTVLPVLFFLICLLNFLLLYLSLSPPFSSMLLTSVFTAGLQAVTILFASKLLPKCTGYYGVTVKPSYWLLLYFKHSVRIFCKNTLMLQRRTTLKYTAF